MFQLFGCPPSEDPNLWIPLQDLGSMRRCRDLPGQVLSRGVPFHVGACRPETASGHIIDPALKGHINRLSILTLKRSQFFRSHLSHFQLLVWIVQKIISILYPKNKILTIGNRLNSNDHIPITR
jgi:hypothetical protein